MLAKNPGSEVEPAAGWAEALPAAVAMEFASVLAAVEVVEMLLDAAGIAPAEEAEFAPTMVPSPMASPH